LSIHARGDNSVTVTRPAVASGKPKTWKCIPEDVVPVVDISFVRECSASLG
jgi:hypothetical protein